MSLTLVATATDVCPTMFDVQDLPPDLAALRVEDGASLSSIQGTVDALERKGVLNTVPESPPAGVTEQWVLRSGYVPRPPPPTETAQSPYKPGGPVAAYVPTYEVWICFGGKVPEVTGQALDEATAAVRARGLDPVGRGQPSWVVTGLDPAAGEIVEFGTVVTLTAEPPAVTPTEPSTETATPTERGGGAGGTGTDESTTSGTTTGRGDDGAESDVLAPITDLGRPWPWLLALVLVALAGLTATGLVRHRAARRPPHEPHVTTRVRDDVPSTRVTELPGVHRAHTVDVRTHRPEPHVDLRDLPPTQRAIPGDEDEGT